VRNSSTTAPPKSGCFRQSTIKKPAIRKCGSMPIEKLFMRSRFFSSEYASHKISASFAASDGCTWIGPSLSQRAAPPPVCPNPLTLKIIKNVTAARIG
jgi:hypothetical protein